VRLLDHDYRDHEQRRYEDRNLEELVGPRGALVRAATKLRGWSRGLNQPVTSVP